MQDKFDVNWKKVEAGEIPLVEKIIPQVEVAFVEPVQA